jgi:dTDP-4-amino-4,6-dideoxygalactose transaminase
VIKLAHPIIDNAAEQAVLEALRSGQLAQGPRVAAFEDAFARLAGTKHAVAVNSGTAALHLALLARGIGPGDDVIVPAFSFAATANAVLQAGARPIFADVAETDFNIDVAAALAAITPATRAIIAVHLYGQMCDIEALQTGCGQHGIALIEDAAQAAGATMNGRPAGSAGDGAFSFYATKNLTTGEGGMLTTNDDGTAARARILRSQGERTRYVTEALGWNYRMTELAAALGLAQLARVDGWNRRRADNARAISEGLARTNGLALPRELPGRRHVWHQYTIRVLAGGARRDDLRAHLRERGIESAVFYPAPIHKQPLYERLGHGDAHLPVSERIAGEVLSIPVHPSLTDDDVLTVIGAVREFFPS